MSLVKYDNTLSQSTWAKRDKKAVRHKIPGSSQRPVIDYDKLKQLCAIEGLQTVKSQTTGNAHKKFMDTYKTIFVEDEKLSGLPIHSLSRSLKKLSDSKSSIATSSPDTSQSVVVANSERLPPIDTPAKPKKENPTNVMSHDIRDYMAKLHKQRQSEDPEAIKRDRIKLLRKLLKKLPFERTASENDQIYNAAKSFDVLGGQVPANVLKELCVVAQLDTWKEPDLTIFGNTGFHFILKGTVRPVADPWVKFKGEEIEFRSPTPEPESSMPELGIGDVFGTLEQVDGREPNTRILSVVTTSEITEFFRISCSDYKRVIDQIRQRDETEKVNLLLQCKAYQYWSKQPLVKVANLLEWTCFPANTVLVSEGYNSPFVAIIKSGECHVLRHVEVLKTLPNGKQEKRTKQVVMGKLGVHDSFGEISIITDTPITCSIVTSAPVELAVIEPEKLKDLDDTTVQLLRQSSEETFGDLTQKDIHNEYVAQELKREWNEYKHTVIGDVINSRGIRPGYGKWSKN